MASRGDIDDAMVDELRAAAVGTHTIDYDTGNEDVTVESTDVTKFSPSRLEEPPQVLYESSGSKRFVNGVGTGQVKATYTAGSVDAYVFRQYRTAAYTIVVTGGDDVEKSVIADAVVRHFEPYELGEWNASDVHADVEDVRVLDVDAIDDSGIEHTLRIDQYLVEVDYHRDYELTDDNIEAFEIEVDADLDDATAGDNYTVN